MSSLYQDPDHFWPYIDLERGTGRVSVDETEFFHTLYSGFYVFSGFVFLLIALLIIVDVASNGFDALTVLSILGVAGIFYAFNKFKTHVESKINNYFENLNEIVAPHRVIDGFVRWEVGDKLSYMQSSAEFVGVSDTMRLIIREGGNILQVPPKFFKQIDGYNESLFERQINNNAKSLEKQAVESQYMEFLKNVKKELKKSNVRN